MKNKEHMNKTEVSMTASVTVKAPRKTARLVVGSSRKNENIWWLSGFYAPGDFIALEYNGERIIMVGALEHERAKKQSRATAVIAPEDLHGDPEKPYDITELSLLLLKKYGITAITVEPAFPANLYVFLKKKRIKITFAHPLFPKRMVKTPEEIADIRHAQRSMEEVFAMILDMIANASIRDGKLWDGGDFVTSEMLRQFFDVELMRRDCVCDMTIIASGDQAVDPHCVGEGPILANVPIVMDMFPRSRQRGYWSDMTRTVVKGKLSENARKMYEAVRIAQARALAAVAPGVLYRDIHRIAKDTLNKFGYQTRKDAQGRWEGFFHSVGHGVGLEIHEPPFPKKVNDFQLEPNHVITVEPGLYYYGVGGVRIEDTVIVTPNGFENLATPTKELLEIP